MVLLQGGEHGLLIICLCDRHHFGWHFQNTAIVRKWCETFETEKAAFFPVRALLSEPCAGFYRKGLACPKDKTFIQRKRETSSLTWSTWKERAKGILLGYKGHGCVLFSLTQEHELVPSCMLILHPWVEQENNSRTKSKALYTNNNAYTRCVSLLSSCNSAIFNAFRHWEC